MACRSRTRFSKSPVHPRPPIISGSLYRGSTTDWLAPNATAAEVEAELETLATIGANNVSVTTTSGAFGNDYLVTFIGEFERDASEEPALLSVASQGAAMIGA